jgi:hypothetical protein
MILRRFGTKIASVVPRLDARALNEIGFTRTDTFEASLDEFGADWERLSGTELAPEVDGDVQDAAEKELFEHLSAGIETHQSALRPDEILLVENEVGKDHPKTRDKKVPVIVNGENRYHFHWKVDPPLKLGLYRRRG